MLHFYNTCLNSFNISTLCYCGIIICSTFSKFSSSTGFGFTFLFAILFPINYPVVSAALWAVFLVGAFRTSSPVLVATSNNCLLYLPDRFFHRIKQHFLCCIFLFLVLWFTRFAVFAVHEYLLHAYICIIIGQSHFFILHLTKDSMWLMIIQLHALNSSQHF